MNRIKNYLVTQASRPATHLMADFFIVGSLVGCMYFGFIH